jgi:AraC-like DNA-binding protein
MSRKLELSAAYARLALQSGVATPTELLQGVSITAEMLADMEFVDAADLAQVFRNYHHHVNDRAWTARIGSQFNIAAHGPLGFAALSAPTLGDSLDVIGTLYPSRNTAMTAKTFATDSHYLLEIEDLTGEPDFASWLAEVVLKVAEALTATVLGHPVGNNVVISFTHAEPPGAAQLIAAYDATVEFNAPRNAIALPLAWRQLPSPLSDESAYRTNMIKCRELIATRDQIGNIAFAVRSQLCIHFDTQVLNCEAPHPPPTLEQVAITLHLTPRTLIRKLQRENTAYKDILESLRREYAERLLGDARLKVNDVADILGYREAANFGRAFRRWYGTSPAAWRRR